MDILIKGPMLGCMVGLVVACSSPPKQVDALANARTAVQRVEAMPDAGKYAAEQISAANEALQEGERLDFPDLILRLIAAGETVRAWQSDDYWLDIGRHDDYEQAQEEFDRMRDRLVPQD